ncbi:MAG: ATP-binding protein [Bacteroidales bacterium]|nr:ATP-binding protein [Bacteroidales bacterium]
MIRNISIISERVNLRLVESLIDEISSELAIGSDDYGKILIATIEAVNNAIIHGNKADRMKTVDVAFEHADNNLVVKVADQGSGFDPSLVPDPTSPENIENLHGRGVFLMKQLCDSIRFSEKGNEVIMEFKIH